MSNDASKNEKKLAELKIERQFYSALRKRLQSQSFQDKIASNEIKKKEYQPERRLLSSLNNDGMTEGFIAGALSFLFLRKGPHIAKRLFERRFENKYFLDRSQILEASNSKQKNNLSSALLNGLKLGMDIFLSLVLAASTSMQFMDEKKIKDTVSSLPLIEGRSFVSDEFCSVIQNELSHNNSQYWKNSNDHPKLSVFEDFARNCSKRQAYERAFRKENGMGESEPVIVPIGGIPANFSGDDMLNAEEMSDSYTDGINDDEFFYRDSFQSWDDPSGSDEGNEK